MALEAINEQRRLLQLEYEEEKKYFSEAVDNIGIDKLIEQGNAWTNIIFGSSWHNSLNQRIVEIFAGTDKFDNNENFIIKDNNFEFGRPVMFFRYKNFGDFKIKFFAKGSVNFIEGARMLISVADNFIIPMQKEDFSYGVLLSFDETSYRVMFDTLDRIDKAEGRLAELRDIIYSYRKVPERNVNPIIYPYLNNAQQKGVNKILTAKDFAIVHGPPGTGKTTTLVEAIYETLRRESQVLVCAQSNSAVDLICERLIERGINVLRIGNPVKVNDKMLLHTYENRFEAHPSYPTLWKLRQMIRELRTMKKRPDTWHRKMDSLKQKAVEFETVINNSIFGEARVIASTLVGSDNNILDYAQISTLFIDEAAQSLEAATWIPIKRASRVILAGDHCQLPATVKCYEAAKQGLGISLMEKMVEMHPESVILLSIQYRMNEDIMRFSSNWFYQGKMIASKEVKNRGILDYDKAIEWIDTSECIDEDNIDISNNKISFKEILSGQSGGRINKDEALLTIHILQEYLTKIGHKIIFDEKIDIAIISPYRAQVRYLRKLISDTPFFQSFRKIITVNTVDGFQGRESDVVLISLVRSNDDGNIGFLKDLRRMNVAMTRARMKLIIIGNSSTLTRYPFYKKLYSYVSDLNKIS